MRNIRLLSILLVSTLPLAGAASAADTAASAAYGESITVHLVPLLGGGITVASGPLPVAAAIASPATDVSNTAVSVSVSTPATGQILATGVLIARAAATPPSGAAATADATVDHLDAAVLGALPLLTLSADVVRATANGGCASGTPASGGTVLTNLRFGGALGLGLVPPTSLPPNTVLLNAAGVRVVLNEQIPTVVDGFPGIAVNAIHISLDALPLGLTLATGDIVIAHAEAAIACDGSGGSGGGGGPTM